MNSLSCWMVTRLNPLLFAQTEPVIVPESSIGGRIFPVLGQNLGQDILSLAKAVIILIVGWIVAIIVKNIIRSLLGRTRLDNQMADWIGGQREGESLPIEKWVAELVFWLIILFTVVAFLNALQLEAVSAPLNTFLQEITRFLPKLFGAALLLAVAWVLATLTKLIVTRVLAQLRIEERLGQQVEGVPAEPQIPLRETIANALYWFIFLLFLPAVLSTLDLQGTLVPVQSLLNKILSILPNILAAILIGAVGWVIAQIVRRVVTNFLSATGIDSIGAKFGLSARRGGLSLSQLLGTLVYVLILIPVAITALDALKIEAISRPATEMLNQVLNLLPKLFAAAVVLILAYVAGRYVSELVTSILTSIGFNNIPQWLGISRRPVSPTVLPLEPPLSSTVPPSATPLDIATAPPPLPTRTPSEWVGIIALVGIMLVAALTAVDILQIQALRVVVGQLLLIAGRVVVALVILALGLYLSNLAFSLIASSGTRQARFLAYTARIAILALVIAMALQQMGIAPNIVNLAFGLLLGGIAVAIALAFGLGGREVAGEQLREWLNTLKR